MYNSNKENYLVNFAQLTRTDGSFIFGREQIDDFDLSMLKGKTILGGRAGGVPEMTLEYVLKNAGLNVVRNQDYVDENSVNVRTDIAFAAMAGSFISGIGDYTTLFEPTATEIVESKKAYLLCSVGEIAGEIPYTAYSTTLNYFENNQDILMKFVRALYKGILYINSHTDNEVAKLLVNQFPDSTVEQLTEVVYRYRFINAWRNDLYFTEEGFNRLMDIMELAGELDQRADYDKLVNNQIVEKVVKDF